MLSAKVGIKPFDANPLNWHGFYDSFSSLVHETTDLPSVQKFHLLKGSLVGEASSVIASLNVAGKLCHSVGITKNAIWSQCYSEWTLKPYH